MHAACFVRHARAPLLTLLALACGEPLEPADVAGVYVLRQVEDDPLPAIVLANDGVIIRVLADTLRLGRNGRGTEVTIREVENRTDGSRTGPEPLESTFGFRTARGRVEIALDCPINANCAPPPHMIARRVGDGVLIMVYFVGYRVPVVYDRVGSER